MISSGNICSPEQALRIAYVTMCGSGGVANYVQLMSRALHNKGAAVSVIGPENSWLEEKVRSGNVVEYIGFPFTAKPSAVKDFLFALKIRRLIKNAGYSIVHSNSFKGGILAALARRSREGTRYVYSAHSTMDHFTENRFVAGFVHAIERWAARRHDFMIAVSESEYAEFIQSGMASPDNSIAIRNGIEMRDLPGNNGYYRHINSALSNPSPVIGTVSRLHRLKGLDYLITGFKNILSVYPRARLLIAGEGPFEANLRNLVHQSGLQEQVRFLGSTRDIYTVLAYLDVFVLPSLWETFPYAILEAGMACVPVVATNVGGVPEMIDCSCGWLVPPRDAHGLAAAIVESLNNRTEALRRAELLHNKILDSYQLEDAVQRTPMVYTKQVSVPAVHNE